MTKLLKDRKPKSDGRIVVNVSFTESEYKILNHADEHGNFSQYVKRLILADMQKQEQVQQQAQQPDAMALLMGLIQSGQLQMNPGMFQPQFQQIQQQLTPEPPQEEQPKLKADKSKVGGVLKSLNKKDS